MKINVLLVMFLVAFAASGSPAQEVTPGYMGIFFDLDATTYIIDAAPYSVVPTYVLMVESVFPEIAGCEFGVEIVGNFMVSAVDFMGDSPAVTDYGDGNWGAALASPMTVGSVTHLATLSIFLMDANMVHFTLSGADPIPAGALDLPAVVLVDGTIQPVCTTAWDIDSAEPAICAAINDPGPPVKAVRYECFGIVPVERHSWDAIKSMYR